MSHNESDLREIQTLMSMFEQYIESERQDPTKTLDHEARERFVESLLLEEKEKKQQVSKTTSSTQTTKNTPQISTARKRKKSKNLVCEDTKYSIEDPILLEKLRKSIQARKGNKKYPQELIDRCFQYTVEKFRNKQEVISRTTLSDIRNETYNTGSVAHMLKEEKRMKEEEELSKSQDPLISKAVKAKRLRRVEDKKYRQKVIIESEEEIDKVAHRNAAAIAKAKIGRHYSLFPILQTKTLKRRKCNHKTGRSLPCPNKKDH